MTKAEEIRRQLEDVKAKYPTEHDDPQVDPYWRGVRVGLETALSILENPDLAWFSNSRRH